MTPLLFKGKLIRFAHIDNLSLEKMTGKDPVSYGVQIADAVGFVVRDIVFDCNWHFGTTDDDMVSLTTIDESHAEVTVGEISDVYIHNVCAYNSYSGIRLLSAGDFAIKNVHISGVYGDYRHNAVLVSHHYTRPNTKIWFDDIVIEHVHASKSTTPLGDDCFTFWEKECRHGSLLWFEKEIRCGRVTLRGISRHETKDSVAYLVQLDKNAVIDRLVAENISQTTDPGVTAPMWFDEATVGTRILRDVEV